MMSISSQAGRRLAKAKARRDELQRRHSAGEDCWPELRDARLECHRAGDALADELIAGGFHEMEGE